MTRPNIDKIQTSSRSFNLRKRESKNMLFLATSIQTSVLSRREIDLLVAVCIGVLIQMISENQSETNEGNTEHSDERVRMTHTGRVK